MKYKNIVFLVSSETSIGVLESQVFKFANYIALNYNCLVKIVLVGEEINFNKNLYSNKLEFHYLNNTISISDIKKSNIYVRTIDIFLKNYIKLKINRNHIIYDFRALLFVESYYRRNNYFIVLIIFILEMVTYFLADQICCVSNKLKQNILKFFTYKKNIFVFPCLVSESETRTRLPRLSNKSVYDFVYVGSLNKWQKFDEVVNLYKNFSEKNESTFTVITKDKENASHLLLKNGVNANILSMNNNQVLNELVKFDFGFLLRDENLLNMVASPIKYLEYLVCGVIPIISSGIGDYSEEAELYNIAIVLKKNNELTKSDLSKLINDRSYNKRLNNYLNNYNYETNIKKHPLINNEPNHFTKSIL